jgi:hypothetical protein
MISSIIGPDGHLVEYTTIDDDTYCKISLKTSVEYLARRDVYTYREAIVAMPCWARKFVHNCRVGCFLTDDELNQLCESDDNIGLDSLDEQCYWVQAPFLSISNFSFAYLDGNINRCWGSLHHPIATYLQTSHKIELEQYDNHYHNAKEGEVLYRAYGVFKPYWPNEYYDHWDLEERLPLGIPMEGMVRIVVSYILQNSDIWDWDNTDVKSDLKKLEDEILPHFNKLILEDEKFILLVLQNIGLHKQADNALVAGLLELSKKYYQDGKV